MTATMTEKKKRKKPVLSPSTPVETVERAEVEDVKADTLIEKMSRDVKAAAKTLDRESARQLVDIYYNCQRQRIRMSNIDSAKSADGKSSQVVRMFLDYWEKLEKMSGACLGYYAAAHPAGRWMLSQYGCGPVLTAGFLAHFDITKAPTAGHFWRYAGLDITQEWLPGQKCPWNIFLKSKCYLLGESFVKSSFNEASVYGHWYKVRKQYEHERNLAGGNAEYIANMLKKKSFGDDTDAVLWYTGCVTPEKAREFFAVTTKSAGLIKKYAGEPGSGVPMLPPSHVHHRATRWAVKLFLSHFHEVWYTRHYGRPCPYPYAMSHLGHAHKIPVPDWDGNA